MQFLNYIKAKFIKFSKIGLKENLVFLEELRIRIINECAISVFIILIFNGFECLISLEYGTPFVFLSAVIPILSLYANHRGRYVLAKFLMTLLLPVFVLFFLVLFGDASGLGYTIIPFTLAPLVLYNNIKLIVKIVLLNFFLFLLGIIYTNNYESLLSSEVTFFNFLANVSAAVLAMLWMIIRFFSGIKQKEKQLSNINSELKENNLKLKLINQENEVKSELLKMLAHDLRGPTIGFKNLSKKLNYLIKNDEIERLQNIGNYFEESSEHLFQNLDNLLNWVMSQTNKVVVNSSTFSLNVLIEETVWDADFIIKKKQIKIIKKIDQEYQILDR